MIKFRLFLVIISSTLLCGCWDYRELNKTGFVISLAVDKLDGGFSLTAEIPSDNAMENGFGEDGSAINKSSYGSTLAEAMEDINRQYAKSAYFGHTKVIIIGEGILNDEKLLKETLSTLDSNKEISEKAILLAAKEGSKILEDGVSGSLVGFYVTDFYNNHQSQRPLTLNQAVGHMVIPYITIGEKAVEFTGGAVVTNKVVGSLNQGEWENFNLLKGKTSFALGEAGVTAYIEISHEQSRKEGELYALLQKLNNMEAEPLGIGDRLEKLNYSWYKTYGHLPIEIRLRSEN